MRLLPLLVCAVSAAAQTYDLAVYGATAAGVATAVSAARAGLKVVLLEPGVHVGGMVSGGLQRTDVGRKEVIGGLALELYFRAGLHYGTMRYLQEVSWLMEPHVAESILRQMLREAGVQLLPRHRLREKNGVRKAGAAVQEIVMENGTAIRSKMFADATYEGDLLAQAGVSYTWGRESSAQYGESLAGVRERTPMHQFAVPISGRDEQGNLLPEISPEPLAAPGTADRKVQAYNFRLVLSDDPANQAPYPKPKHYDPKRYELLARLVEAYRKKADHPLRMNEFFLPANIPNHKADFNNYGAFSTDYIGGNWDYPNASYARRAEIWEDHVEYTKGLLWFFAHDPRVPKPLQDEVNRWGLAKDEFPDTDHWPHQLYIREARRMIGEYVMTQKDIQTDRVKPDPIGMGSYNSDSHNIQRVLTSGGFVMNEGDMEVPVQPYQIPYRMITPRRAEATNLLVPVCFSASHVAYSTLRMEPQYMIIGQAAGIAAKMAIESGRPVQEIDTAALTRTLRSEGAIMEYVPSSQNPVLSGFRRILPSRARVQ